MSIGVNNILLKKYNLRKFVILFSVLFCANIVVLDILIGVGYVT